MRASDPKDQPQTSRGKLPLIAGGAAVAVVAAGLVWFFAGRSDTSPCPLAAAEVGGVVGWSSPKVTDELGYDDDGALCDYHGQGGGQGTNVVTLSFLPAGAGRASQEEILGNDPAGCAHSDFYTGSPVECRDDYVTVQFGTRASCKVMVQLAGPWEALSSEEQEAGRSRARDLVNLMRTRHNECLDS